MRYETQSLYHGRMPNRGRPDLAAGPCHGCAHILCVIAVSVRADVSRLFNSAALSLRRA